jgi:phosphoserine phosphatase RsbU/P
LRELNAVMAADMRSGHYITIVYAIVDVAANRLTWARAGHELPLIARRDQATGRTSVQFVASEGMAVGMVPDALFGTVLGDESTSFAKGDTLVLYTDGLTEAPNEDGKEFSGARLQDAVRGTLGQPPREMNDAILSALRGFAGDVPQRDDFTLVTVQRL